MPLSVIDLRVPILSPSSEASALIAEGRHRADVFYSKDIEQPSAGFLAGDYELVHAALAELRASDHLTGLRFCEWGSGLGVVLGLAGQLGYESFGIELQPELVRESREWLQSMGHDARIATGTYVPGELKERFGAGAEHDSWSAMANEGSDGYQELGLDPRSVDLFYVFPPPSDEEVVLDLFDALAKPGAILLSYRGEDEVLLHRKDG